MNPIANLFTSLFHKHEDHNDDTSKEMQDNICTKDETKPSTDDEIEPAEELKHKIVNEKV